MPWYAATRSVGRRVKIPRRQRLGPRRTVGLGGWKVPSPLPSWTLPSLRNVEAVVAVEVAGQEDWGVIAVGGGLEGAVAIAQ